VWKQRQC